MSASAVLSADRAVTQETDVTSGTGKERVYSPKAGPDQKSGEQPTAEADSSRTAGTERVYTAQGLKNQENPAAAVGQASELSASSTGTDRVYTAEGAMRPQASIPPVAPVELPYCQRPVEDLTAGVPNVSIKHAEIIGDLMSICAGYGSLDRHNVKKFLPQDGSLAELQRSYARSYDAPLDAYKFDLLYAAGDSQELKTLIHELFESGLKIPPQGGAFKSNVSFWRSYEQVPLNPLETAMLQVPPQSQNEGPVNLEGLRRLYPLVERIAAQNGLDPLFVVSLMRYESNFNPDAVSKKGALGPLQVMPDTGRFVDRSIPVSGLKDPEVGIRIGCEYLVYIAGLMDEKIQRAGLQGQLSEEQQCKLAVIAYNAGPHRKAITHLLDRGLRGEFAVGIDESDNLASAVWSMYQTIKGVRAAG